MFLLDGLRSFIMDCPLVCVVPVGGAARVGGILCCYYLHRNPWSGVGVGFTLCHSDGDFGSTGSLRSSIVAVDMCRLRDASGFLAYSVAEAGFQLAAIRATLSCVLV